MNCSLRSKGTDLAEAIELSTSHIMTHVEVAEKKSQTADWYT